MSDLKATRHIPLSLTWAMHTQTNTLSGWQPWWHHPCYTGGANVTLTSTDHMHNSLSGPPYTWCSHHSLLRTAEETVWRRTVGWGNQWSGDRAGELRATEERYKEGEEGDGRCSLSRSCSTNHSSTTGSWLPRGINTTHLQLLMKRCGQHH